MEKSNYCLHNIKFSFHTENLNENGTVSNDSLTSYMTGGKVRIHQEFFGWKSHFSQASSCWVSAQSSLTVVATWQMYTMDLVQTRYGLF